MNSLLLLKGQADQGGWCEGSKTLQAQGPGWAPAGHTQSCSSGVINLHVAFYLGNAVDASHQPKSSRGGAGTICHCAHPEGKASVTGELMTQGQGLAIICQRVALHGLAARVTGPKGVSKERADMLM